ncbi:MAG: hypothetical protein Q9213_005850 [Squamulea squamosa]
MVGQGLGSCTTKNVGDLENSFREAVAATQQAVGAIENLKKSALLKLLSKNRQRVWKRQAQLMKALFNIDVDKSQGLGSSNSDANAVQNYEKPNVVRQSWLFCEDEWLQWKQPTDIDELDTQDPKRSVGEVYGGMCPAPAHL